MRPEPLFTPSTTLTSTLTTLWLMVAVLVTACTPAAHYDGRLAAAAPDDYYNLMGQPVGKDLPSLPGIYINHGNKILVR